MIGFSFLKEIKHFLRSEKWLIDTQSCLAFGGLGSGGPVRSRIQIPTAKPQWMQYQYNFVFVREPKNTTLVDAYWKTAGCLNVDLILGVSKRRDAAGLQTSTISMTQQTSEVKNFSSFCLSGTIKTQRSACEMDYSHDKPLILWTSDHPLGLSGLAGGARQNASDLGGKA